MRTGEGWAESRFRVRWWAVVGLVLAGCWLGGCDTPPDGQVALQASKTTVLPGDTVLLTATVTLEGAPLSGVDVVFSASAGTFVGGNQKTTDQNGQAVTSLQVGTQGGIMTEVTASVTDPAKTASLILTIETGGGGTKPPR